MSMVHSSPVAQTANRVSGGRLPRANRSAAPAATRATPSGTVPPGGSTPCVRSISPTKSRNTTGSPSVTK
jgi:hypothetical protein